MANKFEIAAKAQGWQWDEGGPHFYRNRPGASALEAYEYAHIKNGNWKQLCEAEGIDVNAPVIAETGRIIFGIERRMFNVAEYIIFKGIEDADGIHVARYYPAHESSPYHVNKRTAEKALRAMGHKPFYIEQVGTSRVYKAI